MEELEMKNFLVQEEYQEWITGVRLIMVEAKSKQDVIDGDYEFYMLLYPRSSIIKTNLLLSNSVGVIDSGYRGSIKVCFKYVIQPEDMKIVEGQSARGRKAKGIVTSIDPQRVYHKGDKIAQLIPCKHHDLDIDYVNVISNSERGDSGFGSTNND